MAARPQRHRILLLGASGRIGRMLRRVWQAEGHKDIEIVPVFRSQPGGENGVIWQPGDSEIALPQADSVLALWGVISGDMPDLQANSDLALAAMRVARVVGARTVIHSSSVAVYAFGDDPLDEDSPLAPRSAYGQAKRDMEQLIATQPESDGIRQVVMRIGNVAGTQSLFDSIARGRTVTLDRFADGSGPVRSYIAPHDLAKVILALLRHERLSGPINVAAPVATSMESLVRASGLPVGWKQAPEGAVQRVEMDTTRLAALCPLPRDSAEASHLLDSARATGVWP